VMLVKDDDVIQTFAANRADEAHVAQRMNVDVADVVSPLYVLQPDDRTSDDRSVCPLRRSKPRLRDGGLGGVPLFRDNDAVIRFQFALDDLGEVVVVETDDDGNSYRFLVTQNPDLRLSGIAAAGRIVCDRRPAG
jgi:hypothetical protein